MQFIILVIIIKATTVILLGIARTSLLQPFILIISFFIRSSDKHERYFLRQRLILLYSGETWLAISMFTNSFHLMMLSSKQKGNYSVSCWNSQKYAGRDRDRFKRLLDFCLNNIFISFSLARWCTTNLPHQHSASEWGTAITSLFHCLSTRDSKLANHPYVQMAF